MVGLANYRLNYMSDMEEAKFTDSFTGDVVNDEPIVFKGLTDGEVKMVFILALFIGAPIGVLVALLLGQPMLIIVFILLFPIVAVFFIADKVGKARRGKPPGYVEQTLSIKLSKTSLRSSDYISQSMRWGLGRTRFNKGGE